MREILFRGKRIDNGEWIYGDLLQPTDVVDCTEISQNIGVGSRYDVIPETVGQYIGMTDKNSVKIFEGDIIRGESKSVLVVKYGQNIAAFIAEGAVVLSPRPHTNYYKVIGNIHDNPELLEARHENT